MSTLSTSTVIAAWTTERQWIQKIRIGQCRSCRQCQLPVPFFCCSCFTNIKPKSHSAVHLRIVDGNHRHKSKVSINYICAICPFLPPPPHFHPVRLFLCWTEETRAYEGRQLGVGGNGGRRKGLDRAETKKVFSIPKCKIQYDAKIWKWRLLFSL
jgi:hypothetical protein